MNEHKNDDFYRMQEDALRRVRDMQRRSREAAGIMNEEPPPPPHPHNPHKKNAGDNHGQEKKHEHEPRPEPPHKSSCEPPPKPPRGPIWDKSRPCEDCPFREEKKSGGLLDIFSSLNSETILLILAAILLFKDKNKDKDKNDEGVSFLQRLQGGGNDLILLALLYIMM